MTTYQAIRRIVRALRALRQSGEWDVDLRDERAVVHAILDARLVSSDSATWASDIAALRAAMATLGLTLPRCSCIACGCTADATRLDDESGEPVCDDCCAYAVSDDGEIYCSRCPEYADDGEWTGGGMCGHPTG